MGVNIGLKTESDLQATTEIVTVAKTSKKIAKIKIKNGHKIFGFNTRTGEMKVVKTETFYNFAERMAGNQVAETEREIIYILRLNEKNARKDLQKLGIPMNAIYIHKDNFQEVRQNGIPALAQGDVLVHKEYETDTIYNILKGNYREFELVPVSAGTNLYAIYGNNVSYVSKLTALE